MKNLNKYLILILFGANAYCMSVGNVHLLSQNPVRPPKISGTLYSKSDGKFYDVYGYKYMVVFNAFPSNKNNPSGFCGAGNEIYAYIYQVSERLHLIGNILVSSCKSNIFLKSQDDSGDDNNFASFTWTDSGFKIDWSVYGNDLSGKTKLYDVNGGRVIEK